MATIKDIAKKTGVSVMTVSRALNNPELVKKEVREQILKVAQELNYTPHQGARSLASRKTGIIQVVTRLKTSDAYFLFLLAGIADYLKENKYALIIGDEFDTNYKCDGVIVMSLHEDEKEDFFQSLQIPCVLFGKTHEQIDYVDINNEHGSFAATEYLIELGHRNIGYLGIEPYEAFATERYKGFENAIAKHNLSGLIGRAIFCDNTIEDARRAGEELIKTVKPSAIVCASDMLALGLIEAARTNNLIVPDDLSIVGYDGVYLHKNVIPSLTTVRQPVFEIGRKLSKVLIERIKNNKKEQECYIFEPSLLIGESAKDINLDNRV